MHGANLMHIRLVCQDVFCNEIVENGKQNQKALELKGPLLKTEVLLDICTYGFTFYSV